jgi:hypothetical protein
MAVHVVGRARTCLMWQTAASQPMRMPLHWRTSPYVLCGQARAHPLCRALLCQMSRVCMLTCTVATQRPLRAGTCEAQVVTARRHPPAVRGAV